MTKPQATPPKRRQSAVTDRRKAAFLEALRQTGSLRWAATLASPHLTDRPRKHNMGHGIESFRDAAKRDPEFAAAIEEALNEALGKAEKLLAERMLTPDTRPVIDKNGNIVAVATDHRNANNLLLRFLERHDAGWAPRKHLSGDVTHQHQHLHAELPSAPGYTVTAADIRQLPEEKRRLLISLLDDIEDNRHADTPELVQRTAPALPAATED